MDFSFVYLKKKNPNAIFLKSHNKGHGLLQLEKRYNREKCKSNRGARKKSKGKSVEVEPKVCSSN
jgi:hypothetical protein